MELIQSALRSWFLSLRLSHWKLRVTINCDLPYKADRDRLFSISLSLVQWPLSIIPRQALLLRAFPGVKWRHTAAHAPERGGGAWAQALGRGYLLMGEWS